MPGLEQNLLELQRAFSNKSDASEQEPFTKEFSSITDAVKWQEFAYQAAHRLNIELNIRRDLEAASDTHRLTVLEPREQHLQALLNEMQGDINRWVHDRLNSVARLHNDRTERESQQTRDKFKIVGENIPERSLRDQEYIEMMLADGGLDDILEHDRSNVVDLSRER